MSGKDIGKFYHSHSFINPSDKEISECFMCRSTAGETSPKEMAEALQAGVVRANSDVTVVDSTTFNEIWIYLKILDSKRRSK